MLDAWGTLAPDARARIDERLVAATVAATARVGDELRALFALEAAHQHATPLQVVRGAVTEPTAVLSAVGVPPVVRDEFEERSSPDDRYGLAPRTFADLGDDELGPAQLVWGTAKATVLRATTPDPGGP